MGNDFGKDSVYLVIVISVFRERIEKIPAKRLLAVEIAFKRGAKVLKRSFTTLVNKPFQNEQGICKIRDPDEAGHHPIISCAPCLDILTACKAIVHEAGEQRLERMLRTMAAA